jgi:tetratricopeptide (TPR) repeat protein
MRSLLTILLLFACLDCLALADDKPKPGASKQDAKTADKEYKHAIELQQAGKTEDAMLAVTRAVQLVPGNVEYVTMSEMLRQQIVSQHLGQGNRFAENGDTPAAAEEFRQALAVDPQNSYVVQRLSDISPRGDPERQHTLQLLASVDQINLSPASGKKSFHLQGDTRSIYTQIGTAFGIIMRFDQSMPTRALRFDLDDIDFYNAMALLGKITKTFWAPVTNHEAMVASDTQELRRQYERLALRTFYLGNISTPTDLNDVANVLRSILDIRLVNVDPAKGTISVRAPREQVEAAAILIDNIMDARPEMLLDVKEYEFDTDNLRQAGLNLPTDFQVFNIPSEIRKVLGPDAQPVIDQINQTGTIDPSKIPASALSNLQGSPLLSPFIFFGKGLGLTGITTNPISGTLAMNSSFASTLEHVTLRALDGESATFRVGTKLPIVSSTFSTVAFSNKGAAELGNTPSFQYEDLGLTLKTTPHYHANGEVTLKMDLKITGLGTQQFNSIPDLTTRSYEGTITVTAGEPSVIMGAVTEQELRSSRGLPLLSQLPGFRTALTSNSKERVHNEILVVITPYILRKPFHDKGSSVIWSMNP